MGKFAVWALLLAAPAAFGSGWKNLLPDPSLDGWTRVTIPPGGAVTPGEHWKVDTGARSLV
ncbi:MAG: hypothetical protein ACRD9L_14555, partial [Bryobacteraceae bacterium]